MHSHTTRTPEERSLAGKIAAHTRWAGTSDRQAATAPAREAAWDRFERQVDPDGTLDPDVRAKLAEHARSAFFARLTLMSVKARRARKLADALDAEVAAEGGDL